jgi:hypothetical protein
MPDRWLPYHVTKHKQQVFVAEQYYYHRAMLILRIYVDRYEVYLGVNRLKPQQISYTGLSPEMGTNCIVDLEKKCY